MTYQADTPEDYIAQLPADRQGPMRALRQTLLDNLPEGFEECISYNMIGYVVPHARYPDGYHVNPKLPLPFINIASQKNFIALYHNGIYADPELLAWFQAEYPKHSKRKLDMGKSCIRFKKVEELPLELIAELAQKMDVDTWIARYEAAVKKR
ncbi:MAG: DUF1801 domain-containing protein [Bacteroidetes bacterium]|nr:MAG: DUF1801 domain-containing protein [Bacteroidota bacterium]